MSKCNSCVNYPDPFTFVIMFNPGNCEEELPKKPVGRLSAHCWPTGFLGSSASQLPQSLQKKCIYNLLTTTVPIKEYSREGGRVVRAPDLNP